MNNLIKSKKMEKLSFKEKLMFAALNMFKPALPTPIASESLSRKEQVAVEYEYFVENYVKKGEIDKLRKIYLAYGAGELTLGQSFALNKIFTRIEKGDSL